MASQHCNSVHGVMETKKSSPTTVRSEFPESEFCESLENFENEK